MSWGDEMDEDEEDTDDVCCICGDDAVADYDNRVDCPSCGSPACELRMQVGLDYIQERG